MKRITISIALCALSCVIAAAQIPTDYKVLADTSKEPIADGPYSPTPEGLSGFECPEWFANAKFGIWAHWGPQCAPEDGDWYGRNMYDENSHNYQYQIDAMGHPSEFGFKDWLPRFKAEKWDPEALIKLYKEVGARYFMALANHHDNFDLYDSKYQEWNSVAIGPERDIIGEWKAACEKFGMPFGVSVHASHAWSWYESSRGADTKGALKGVPYDGWLTKEDGAGKWWEGLDPQELYAQNHPYRPNLGVWDWWEWQPGRVDAPDQAYIDKFYNRTVQLINDYNPDIIYFDDSYLPLWPVSDVGLKITAHMYNKSVAANGTNKSVITAKQLNDWQEKTVLRDVERGALDHISEKPWQTCTCIGEWHYDKHVFYRQGYKPAALVVGMLVDIVSKNGNLLLSVPLKSDGSLDSEEIKILERLGAWMKINSESIYDTKPWKIFGEGPAAEGVNPLSGPGFNEGKLMYGSKDIRFTSKGDNVIYVTVFGIPEELTVIRSLGRKTEYNTRKIKTVELLGSDAEVSWTQTGDSLSIAAPASAPAREAIVYKVTLSRR